MSGPQDTPGRLERLERVAANTPGLREWVKVLAALVGAIGATVIGLLKLL